MDSTKKIPYSSEVEGYILGSLMIEENLADEFCPKLNVEDFYKEENKKIFSAMAELYKNNKEIDVSSVLEQLKQFGQLEAIGGTAYLMSLIESVPSTISTETYVDILQQKSLERELYYKVQEIAKKIIDGNEDFSELLAQTEKDIFRIVNKQKTSNLMAIDVATEEVFKIIEDNQKNVDNNIVGWNTGYEELNEYTHGFKPGELIILAARPAIGKSAFALNIAANMCDIDKAYVAFFSLEMGIDQLVMRLLSTKSNVKLDKIISGGMNDAEMARLLQAKSHLDRLHLYLDESTTSNIEDMKVKCRKLKREGHLDFLVVDYLQLMSVGKGAKSRQEEVSILSRSLKLLARELNVPVLALSQLSRSVEQRTEEQGKKPILSDLRESGSIEQDADMVMFLHRENTKKEEEAKQYVNAKTEIIIAKNRQGMTGSFNLIFRGDCSAFTEVKKKKEE